MHDKQLFIIKEYRCHEQMGIIIGCADAQYLVVIQHAHRVKKHQVSEDLIRVELELLVCKDEVDAWEHKTN